MSSSSRTVVRSDVAPSTIFLALDGHKESVTIAVLPSDAAAPTHIDTLSYDLKKLRRYLVRLDPVATLRACDEASGAGSLLQRELATRGVACTVIAPSLIPTKPGVRGSTTNTMRRSSRGSFGETIAAAMRLHKRRFCSIMAGRIDSSNWR